MAEQVDIVYKTREVIIAEVLAAWQANVPDIVVSTDSITRIWTEVFGESCEGLYLAMQLLHDDIFIQSMNALALIRKGEEVGRPLKKGTLASGEVTLSGRSGAFVQTGTTVGSPRPNLDDTLYFDTTEDATIPDPGVPTAPVAADAGSGAAPAAGTYEYVVTFLTAEGETTQGAISNAVVLGVAHNVNLTSIPLGGDGTTGRRIYRRLNGGLWGVLTTLANNVATTYTDNNAATTGTFPPDTSTAEAVTVPAQAQEVGIEYNVAIGAITELTDVNSDLSSVTNVAAFAGGSDDEDIEKFRTELLKWVRAPQSGAPDDLIVWATSVPGVESASVTKNVNLSGSAELGSVVVRISGPDGTIPDSDVVDAVQAELESRDLANITIYVGTFTANVVNVAVTITPATGYILADVQESARLAARQYINSIPPGGTVYKNGLVDSMFGLAGIADVVVTTPGANVTSTATQKPTMGTWTPS